MIGDLLGSFDLERHGLYAGFIGFVLLVVAVCVIESLLEANRTIRDARRQVARAPITDEAAQANRDADLRD